jgi:hypothetical protein
MFTISKNVLKFVPRLKISSAFKCFSMTSSSSASSHLSEKFCPYSVGRSDTDEGWMLEESHKYEKHLT